MGVDVKKMNLAQLMETAKRERGRADRLAGRLKRAEKRAEDAEKLAEARLLVIQRLER